MASEPIKVLFVCLGNICRSPLAEGLFRELVEAEGVAERFEIDSAGTSSYHTGESPDTRAAKVARRRGVQLSGSARQVTEEDIGSFDYLIVMDTDNLSEVERLAERVKPGAEVHLLREFDPEAEGEIEVPDPYYGGPQGFERVHQIIERSCRGLFEHIQAERAL
ncbi:MAG: low molecular weight protein-tyrosine-phosphatase [Gemmatimonadota bacterium]